jgi:hypothetical protein
MALRGQAGRVRGALYIDHGKAFFRSKTKRVMRRFQNLADGLAKVLNVRSAVFDGEILVMEGPPLRSF